MNFMCLDRNRKKRNARTQENNIYNKYRNGNCHAAVWCNGCYWICVLFSRMQGQHITKFA